MKFTQDVDFPGSAAAATYKDVWICVFAWNKRQNMTWYINTMADSVDVITVKQGRVALGFVNKFVNI